jgi:hypothetical protein
MTCVTASKKENLLTAVFGLWLITGLFVDGWAHTNRAELETFFTPWHGLFYSGFTATALWIAWMIRRRRISGSSLSESIPPGYRLAALGLGIFAIGGVGDSLWHTFLGIETGVDALISPTHIILLVGIVLIVGAPMRSAALAHPGRQLPKEDFLPVGLSMGLTALIVSFFFMYTYAPSFGMPAIQYTPDGAGGFEAEFGIMQILITTVIVTGSVLYLAARRDTPLWTFTAILGFLGLLMCGMQTQFEQPWEMIAPLLAGLAADLFIRRFRPHPESAGTWLALGGVIPLVMWSTYFSTFAIFGEIGWTPELWAGSIVLGVLVGLGLAQVMGRTTSLSTPSKSGSEAMAA